MSRNIEYEVEKIEQNSSDDEDSDNEFRERKNVLSTLRVCFEKDLFEPHIMTSQTEKQLLAGLSKSYDAKMRKQKYALIDIILHYEKTPISEVTFMTKTTKTNESSGHGDLVDDQFYSITL